MRLLVLFLIFIVPLSLSAKGVRAGTVITNMATMSFSIGDSQKYSMKSNTVKSTVLQLLSLSLIWQDSNPIEIYEGAKKKVLTCSVINNGNGNDIVLFKSKVEASLADSVSEIVIYEDTNENGKFDQGDLKTNQSSLEADMKKTLFLLTSLKEDLDLDVTKLKIDLSATSKRGGSGIRGTLHEGKGVDGVDAIDGVDGGVSREELFYKVVFQKPTFTKRVTYDKENRYFLVELFVNLNGNATLKNINLNDEIPEGLLYRKNSIKLNGHYQSDKKDRDSARYDDRRKSVFLSFNQIALSKNINISYILEKERL